MQTIKHIHSNIWWGDATDAQDLQQLQKASIEKILVVGHSSKTKVLDNFIYQVVDIPNIGNDTDFDYIGTFQNVNKFLSMGNVLVEWVGDRQKAAILIIAYIMYHEHWNLSKSIGELLSKNILSHTLSTYYQEKLFEYSENVVKDYQDSKSRERAIFDRQIRIQDWNQKKIKDQVVLILGTGGLGTVVLLHLLRIGVGKIILVDKDTIDYSNLPRQIMFGLEDVGTSKVDAAIKNCQIHNISGTILEGYNIDVIQHFNQVVNLAKNSTFIFNLIDHGDYWDLAVQSLCIKLKLPHVSGGNFSNSMMLDYYPATGRPCFLCLTPDLKEKEVVSKLHPDNILTHSDISFCPPNENPISESFAMLCTACGIFLANMFKMHIFAKEGTQTSKRNIFYLDDMEAVKFDLEKNINCSYCQEEKIPMSSVQTESTVVKSNIADLWQYLKQLKLEEMFPEFIESTCFESGAPMQLDSIVKITYKNKKTQKVKITEISPGNHMISYEVLESELQQYQDTTSFTFLEKNILSLKQITAKNWTYISWVSLFPTDLTPSFYENLQKTKIESLSSLRFKSEPSK